MSTITFLRTISSPHSHAYASCFERSHVRLANHQHLTRVCSDGPHVSPMHTTREKQSRNYYTMLHAIILAQLVETIEPEDATDREQCTQLAAYIYTHESITLVYNATTNIRDPTRTCNTNTSEREWRICGDTPKISEPHRQLLPRQSTN